MCMSISVYMLNGCNATTTNRFYRLLLASYSRGFDIKLLSRVMASVIWLFTMRTRLLLNLPFLLAFQKHSHCYLPHFCRSIPSLVYACALNSTWILFAFGKINFFFHEIQTYTAQFVSVFFQLFLLTGYASEDCIVDCQQLHLLIIIL